MGDDDIGSGTSHRSLAKVAIQPIPSFAKVAIRMKTSFAKVANGDDMDG